MCGIAGIYDLKHKIENQQPIFEKMIQSMKQRGPTDDDLYIHQHIALMHARLAIIDIEHGKQPIKINEYVMVYNGECYNTPDLKKQLSDEGIQFTTNTDSEVILQAYIHYQERCLSMIRGIFSLAIYNEKKNSLFIARDPMGVKPLFYTIVDEILIFASEIKTLFEYPLVLPIIDEHSIHQIAYLGPSRIQGSGIFKNIFELKGGEYAYYVDSKLDIKTYYTLKSHMHMDDYDETVDNVKKLVSDSIKSQLVSDVNLGVFLSGGLDSSIIVAVASNYYRQQNKKLKTFSLEFEDDEQFFTSSSFQSSLDTNYIDIASKYFDTDHHIITINTSDLIHSLYQAVEARDLPGMADIDTSLLLFCEKVKKEVDVVLTGECADEIFGGYPWFRNDLASSFPWINQLELRQSMLQDKYQIDIQQYLSPLSKQTLNSTSINEYDTEKDIHRKQMIQLNLHWFMQTLLDRNDRMSMANGLEARVPFCDIQVLDYIYSVPWSFHSVNSMEKGLLREAFVDLLPNEIIKRKKNPFPKTHHPNYLKYLQNELLKLDENEPLWKIFKQDEVLKLCHNESNLPWFGQLMTTPQMIAYFLQINYWLKKYQIQIQ
ncbi:MAG: asparagine synthase (glutamine-hydrolyzing) [Traorella sp.]